MTEAWNVGYVITGVNIQHLKISAETPKRQIPPESLEWCKTSSRHSCEERYIGETKKDPGQETSWAPEPDNMSCPWTLSKNIDQESLDGWRKIKEDSKELL